MERSYNEARILFDRFTRRGTKSMYIDIPQEAMKAADWNRRIDTYNVYQMNIGTLIVSQQYIPSLEKLSTCKVNRSKPASGQRYEVQVTITNIMAEVIRRNTPKAVVAVRTTGKDNRIYIQAI